MASHESNYDCPKNSSSLSGQNFLPCFNVRPPIKENQNITFMPEDSYDVPRPTNFELLQNQNTQHNKCNALINLSSSAKYASVSNIPIYDFPRRSPFPIQRDLVPDHNQQKQNISNLTDNMPCGSTFSFFQPSTIDHSSVKQVCTLDSNKWQPLDLAAAIQLLSELQLETNAAIFRILSLVSPNWRFKKNLDIILIDIRSAINRLRNALHDYTKFIDRAYDCAKHSIDRRLASRMEPYVIAIRNGYILINANYEILELQDGWTLRNLEHGNSRSELQLHGILDELLACVQKLVEDVRQTTSFIQGNAMLLYKTESSKDWCSQEDMMNLMGQYNCISSASKEASDITNYFSFRNKNKYEKITENMSLEKSRKILPELLNSCMKQKVKSCIQYYTIQISTHMGTLRQAVGSFLETVEKNQPPTFFLTYAKFVIVSAHNLITIGDIVYRNIFKFHEIIIKCVNTLSDALKTCVYKSKKAAAQFPNVTAVQEMVDAIVNVSQIATELNTIMLKRVHLVCSND